MRIKEFQLERLFARYKKKAKFLLSNTACESITMREILDMADDECRSYWERLDLGYPLPKVNNLLKEAIAQRFTTIRPADIMTLTPEEGIFIFMNTLLSPGDEVVVMHPCFPSLYEIPRALGCKVIKWPLKITSWGWRLDMKFLAENITPNAKLIVLNVPNNPTGFVPVPTEMERIINIADKMGAWVFCEETYRGMEHDPAGEVQSVSDIYSHGVSVGGLSKFGLPGTRIGWLVTKNRQLLSQCEAYRDYTTYCNSVTSEVLATIAMRNAKDLLKRNHQIVLENLSLAEAFFKAHKKIFKWVQPDGGSIAFPQLLPPLDVTEMCDRAWEEKDMMIIGDRVFETDDNHFRIGFGRRDFPMALAVFKGIAEELEESIGV